MKGILESLLRVDAKVAAPTQTEGYPEVKPDLPPRYRARIILSRHPDGQERCVACNLCAVACPVDCIDVVNTRARQVDDPGRHDPAGTRGWTPVETANRTRGAP